MRTNRGLAVIDSNGSGTRNLVFGLWKCHGEIGLRQAEQEFSSFSDFEYPIHHY